MTDEYVGPQKRLAWQRYRQGPRSHFEGIRALSLLHNVYYVKSLSRRLARLPPPPRRATVIVARPVPRVLLATMCFDETAWQHKPYRKHHTPPSYRDKSHPEINAITRNADSRYYPERDSRTVEEQVLRNGTYVRCLKPNTVYKVHEFPSDVGASDGESSKWVKVECTKAEYHGRPISEAEYRKHITRTIPCCT